MHAAKPNIRNIFNALQNLTNLFSNERPLYAVFLFRCALYRTPAQMYSRI